jgi:hypothetical protein
MIGRLISSFSKPKLTEENVIKKIRDWKCMCLERGFLAKDHVSLKILQERDDLRQSFLSYIEDKMKSIVSSENPYYLFRKKIIETIKVEAINGVLLRKEFDGSREKICAAITRGMKYSSEHWSNPNVSFEQAKDLIRKAEAFYSEEWNYTKIVHEFAWSEAEGLVLRHMQVLLFREKVSYDDWWHIYSQAWEEYVEGFYRLIASKEDTPAGFPHPLLIPNDTLMRMEDTLLKSVEQ